MNTEDNMSVTTTRAGAWIGTLNNPTPEDRVALRTQQRWMRSCKGQDEVGESGTLHIQFLVCTDWIRMSSLKRWLPRAHFEPCRGTQHVTNASNYVHKPETAVEGTQFNYVYRGDTEVVSTNKVLVSLWRIRQQEFTERERQCIARSLHKDDDPFEVENFKIPPKEEKVYYACMSIYLQENAEHVNFFGNRVLKELWMNCQGAIIAWYIKDEEERSAAAAQATDLV